MIDLTNTAAIAQKALDAYHDGTLQAVKSRDMGCSYVGPCAIGVSIPVDMRAELDDRDMGSGISTLIRDEIVMGDMDALQDMQRAHDMLAGEFFDQGTYREHAEFDFLIVTTFYAMGLDK
jgi:hypothetical protein